MKPIFYIVILCCGLNFAQSWTIKGTMPDPLVSGAEAVSDESFIYIFGGFKESSNSSLDDIRIYNPGNNSWENKTSMKEKRSYFVSGTYNNDIYFFGGMRSTLGDADIIEIWNKVNKGKEYSSNDVFNRRNSTGLILNNIFYIFGGHSTVENYPYLVEYNIPEKMIRYQNSYNFTSSPAQQMCASDGQFIYLFGGVFQGVSKNIYKYNPSDKSFTKLNINLRTARAGGRAVALSNNRIMIIGGYNETHSALSSTEIFTINNNTYSISDGPSLNSPRKDFMAPILNRVIYVFGGRDSTGQPINRIESLNTITAVQDNYPSAVDYRLMDNYPNPFNPVTTISFSLNQISHVVLKIHNLMGEEIVQLINNDMTPGTHSELFDVQKYGLSSGIYFYSLSVNGLTETRKMVLMK